MSVGTWQEYKPAYKDESGLWVFSRAEFAQKRFQYKPGQHVVFGGPTTRGKTRLAFQLLEYIISPDLPAYVAVSKPRDKETAEWGEKLHLRRVEQWPPQKRISEYKVFNGPPNGYLIWPKFGDLHSDDANCARVTANLLGDRYTAGTHGHQGILVMDDTMVKAKILNLDGQMVTIIAMAGAMGIGEWLFVQKPTDSGRITLWGYENATHLFLTKGGDDRMLDRYREIAGEHGKVLKEVIPTLKPFQFIYMHKYEGWICVVDAS